MHGSIPPQLPPKPETKKDGIDPFSFLIIAIILYVTIITLIILAIKGG